MFWSRCIALFVYLFPFISFVNFTEISQGDMSVNSVGHSAMWWIPSYHLVFSAMQWCELP